MVMFCGVTVDIYISCLEQYHCASPPPLVPILQGASAKRAAADSAAPRAKRANTGCEKRCDKCKEKKAAAEFTKSQLAHGKRARCIACVEKTGSSGKGGRKRKRQSQ